MISLNNVMVFIQCQIFKIILSASLKRHGKLPTNPRIHIYISSINNKIVFRMKDGYTLDLKTPETMKLFGSTKNYNKWRKITKLHNKEWRKCTES